MEKINNKEQQMSDTAVITSEERAATPEVILPCPACGGDVKISGGEDLARVKALDAWNILASK